MQYGSRPDDLNNAGSEYRWGRVMLPRSDVCSDGKLVSRESIFKVSLFRHCTGVSVPSLKADGEVGWLASCRQPGSNNGGEIESGLIERAAS